MCSAAVKNIAGFYYKIASASPLLLREQPVIATSYGRAQNGASQRSARRGPIDKEKCSERPRRLKKRDERFKLKVWPTHTSDYEGDRPLHPNSVLSRYK